MSVELLEVSLENIEAGYIALFAEALPEYLAAVEARYIMTDPIALPPPASGAYYSGNIPDEVLYQVVSAFPCVTVEATAIDPTGDPTIATVSALLIRVVTLGTSTVEANKLNHRYAWALASLVRNERPSDVGIKEVGQVGLQTAETLAGPYTDFVKAARISAPLTVGVVL